MEGLWQKVELVIVKAILNFLIKIMKLPGCEKQIQALAQILKNNHGKEEIEPFRIAVPDEEFVGEAEDTLEQLKIDLDGLKGSFVTGQKDKEVEIVLRIFRNLHTLKGVASLFGFNQFSTISFTLENYFDALRMDKAKLSLESFRVIGHCLGVLKYSIITRENDQLGKIPDLDDLINQVAALPINPVKAEKGLGAKAGIDEEILNILAEYEEHRLEENIREGNSIYKIYSDFALGSFDDELANLHVQIKELGEIITSLPSSDGFDGNADKITFMILLASKKNLMEITEFLAAFNVRVVQCTDKK
ncbi:MAG: hypothetical protein A2Y82_00625 [Candidatus Buchananbacteria bacterium RBG_13_36_9]|uniref:HPt domain-containing protein n=1 Tax=Candidatus Buchananbacteria bacterium RBG_13_36_9 TaxID=1797530 RepID=A0A1G1XR65_9BACT|nr:MAG: hypothetical protein A2Y82_00625 [Candidatus Buchananbacteria bacterium RBG_13_36_9]